MLNECIEGLNIKENGIYFDGTLGGGGHSSEILKRLKNGLLIATDKDDDALQFAGERLKKISSNFRTVKIDFKNFSSILDEMKIDKIDGVLLDLGVSSYQLDNTERGFSYSQNAVLDMRMDKSAKLTAKYVVNNYEPEKLLKIFYEYGEEPFSKDIVKKIVEVRAQKPIETTGELVEIVKSAIPKKFQIGKGNPAKRIFQAIRIEVNGELSGLYEVVNQMIDRLKVGGRMAVITFHSLEDRIIKDAFKLNATGCICPKNIPVCVCGHKATVKILTKKPLIPSDSEQQTNSRSTSSKLRIIEKIA